MPRSQNRGFFDAASAIPNQVEKLERAYYGF